MVGTPIGIKGVSPEAATYDRLRQARALIDQSAREHRPVLAADGGIRENTVQPLREAGADTVVMGSLAFGAPDLVGTIETVADSLFGNWTIAFLSTVLLLTIAALGTIALAMFGPTAVASPDSEEGA